VTDLEKLLADTRDLFPPDRSRWRAAFLVGGSLVVGAALVLLGEQAIQAATGPVLAETEQTALPPSAQSYPLRTASIDTTTNPVGAAEMWTGWVGSMPSMSFSAHGTPAFDRSAAAASLGSIDVRSCKKPNGPTGAGHVTITFSPDGTVASARVDSGPFSGTAAGGCIAGKYRAARVPRFGGAAVRVGKSFTIPD
jgi:hypothetical protein